jgi:phosphohistidine swiveling domain-containing protein
MKLITIDEEKITCSTTEARAEGKNKLLKTVHNGMKLVCERPQYALNRFERDLFAPALDKDGNITFGRELHSYFEKSGRWWCPEELSSQNLTDHFIRNPFEYLRIMSQKVVDTKRMISILGNINSTLDSKDTAIMVRNLEDLQTCYSMFYSYYSPTYTVYDEVVHRFRRLLRDNLAVKKANTYFCEFLRAEMTKEAIKQGLVGENTTSNRTPTTAKDIPTIFYAEPKLLHESKMDVEVLQDLHEVADKDTLEKFMSLRLIVPAAIQINEEAQYIECKMLWPITARLVEKIKQALVSRGLVDSSRDIKEYPISQVSRMLSQDNPEKDVALSGMGVSQGKVTGRVKIITGPRNSSKFDEGDILVTRITNPRMVLLMSKAAGIICDIGGIASHPSIVSREMGTPCIVSAKCPSTGRPATEVLKDGMLVEMDGATGEVNLKGDDNVE